MTHKTGLYSTFLLQVLVLRQNSIIRARKLARPFSVECKPCFNAKALFAMRFQLIRSRWALKRIRSPWILDINKGKQSKKQTAIFIFSILLSDKYDEPIWKLSFIWSQTLVIVIVGQSSFIFIPTQWSFDEC